MQPVRDVAFSFQCPVCGTDCTRRSCREVESREATAGYSFPCLSVPPCRESGTGTMKIIMKYSGSVVRALVTITIPTP